MTDPKATAPTPFRTVPNAIDFPKDEARILALWKERRIFEKTLAREGRPGFVFYEGPPTANGMPHNGHVLTRVIKDLFPRYKTMRGYRVPRKAGWDTHGLPVEVEVEKELRIHGKAEIERYGVEPFVKRCIESVFRYTKEWEDLTEKIGFWVDLDDAYVTYHRAYVESVWWALATLFRRGLLYQSHKVVWWWAQGGTALSANEVGQGYRTVDDPSAYVAFPLRDDPETALLVWTTTPWTLPSNSYAAVKPDVDYVTVQAEGRKLVVAAALRDEIAKKLGQPLPVLETKKGKDWVGARYLPPFDLYARRLGDEKVSLASGGETYAYFRLIGADFVTLDTGTGIVHIAPAFGEDDYVAHTRELARYLEPGKVELLSAVRPDGTFVDDFAGYAGTWVKAADKGLLGELRLRGTLVFAETYRHEYPFCWRADEDPLIQLARPTWYIRTTQEIDRARAANQEIQWLPDHIKNGRFGDFLANNVDWALSRERYWGTPLPLWVNAATGEIEAITSLAELRGKPGNNVAEVEAELEKDLAATAPHLAEHLIVHKPWIDKITYERPGMSGRFERVREVVDCWFDSGCMPFAQWGFPHAAGSKERFVKAFPADFISEAIDQTRGWFYSLLMVSTMLFDDQTLRELGVTPADVFPHPYQTCLVLGHVCDKDGKKESKSKGNYTPPDVILDRVRMDFAVVFAAAGHAAPAAGHALIAREDLEGLDLNDGAKVVVYRADVPNEAGARHEIEVRAGKGLPRRVVVLSPDDARALSVREGKKGASVLPVEVPRLPADERVTLEDPSTPAPGADAFRWFFCASSPPWSNTRHSLSNVRALQKDFTIKLRNVFSFFAIYATIDGWSPALGNAAGAGAVSSLLRASRGHRPVAERALLDRWVLSELALLVRDVTADLDRYLVYDAAQKLARFVESLSNWYVRRSRERFWAPGLEQDKVDAYMTLYEALVTTAELAAPFIPFFAEEMYQNLVLGPFPRAEESIHLRAYPSPDLSVIDEPLAEEMRAVRDLVSLGLSVRTTSRLKVRQPLDRADIVLAEQRLRERLAAHAPLILDELNVNEVRFLSPGQEGDEVRYRLKPNFRALGPKLGKNVQLAKKALERADAGALRTELATRGSVSLSLGDETIALVPEDIEVVVEAADGFAAAGDRVGVVVLHTALTEDLIDAGIAREVISRVQGARKELGLGYAERIELILQGSPRILRVCERFRDAIAKETLAVALRLGPIPLERKEDSAGLGVAESRENAFLVKRSAIDDEPLSIGILKRV